MILIIDNYDSFTYNLVQYIGEMEPDIEVFRNDKISLDEIEQLAPDKIVISPGPCTPLEAGISNEGIKQFGPKTPLLGVCLGHQCIGYTYGGKVIRADRLMHGKTSMITHTGAQIFDGVESPFEATRYHSLIVERASLPDCLEIIAETDQNEIMGLKHTDYPVWGLQFHPESILTTVGKTILHNFLRM
ncbi:MAG: aminodeoxychorismate/anthranilate synthase component II [Candidatus Hydrogenedentes bacterium]|nr:aminodeoxychorismate/anthranilate synthase component II [Candidatus Hydrogenedentota bacterium]